MIYPISKNKLKSSDYAINLNFLSDEEIQMIFDLSQNINYEEGETIDKTKNIRECLVKSLPWDDNFSWLYEKIVSSVNNINDINFGFSINGINSLQLIRYEENSIGYFPHVDTVDVSPNVKRKISLSIQLSNSDDYRGGDVIIDCDTPRRCVFSRNKGSIIIFKSDLKHQVLPISSGVRYSLVTWICGAYLE